MVKIIPEDFIEKLKNSIDMKELASEYTKLEKSGMKNGKPIYKGICPNPDHHDKDPSFVVWECTNSWACMSCHHGKKNEKYKNYGSDCIAFIRWIKKCSYYEAVKFLCDKYGIEMPTDKNAKLHQAMLNRNKELAYKYYMNLKGEPLEYIKSRGFSFSDCKKYGIGVTLDNQKIVFPLMDRMGNVLGFTKRWIHMQEDKDDKYRNSKNSPIFNKGMYLYGLDELDTDFPEIRITEGPIDRILSAKYGAKNVVATLGTAFTEHHAEIIKHYGMIPVFMFDGDNAGLKAIKRAAQICADIGVYCKILIIPDNEDLADLTLKIKEEIEDYICENSQTYGNYLIQEEMHKFISKENELKLQYYPKLLSILEKVPNQKEKNILKSYIQSTMHIDL